MSWRHATLALAALASAIAVFARAPIAQDLAYHRFADQRGLLGIPNCFDVLSNVPFAMAGVYGLLMVFRHIPSNDWIRWPYATLFAGAALTAFGSGYYHLAPDNGRLVWDRLPMTIGFMGLLAAVLGERVSLTLGRLALVPLLVVGGGSVGYWHWTELRQAGDLRPYALVQFGSLLIVLLALILYRPRYTGSGWFYAGIGAYALAKGFELADGQIFAAGQVVSGHSLKHLAAAVGIGCVAVMLAGRKPLVSA
jgi:hypothetical protein